VAAGGRRARDAPWLAFPRLLLFSHHALF
jgi:hypothetical protein